MRLKLGKYSVFSIPQVILVFLMIVQWCDFAEGKHPAIKSEKLKRPNRDKGGNFKMFH